MIVMLLIISMIISPISIYAQEDIEDNENVTQISDDYYKVHIDVLRKMAEENVNLNNEVTRLEPLVDELKSSLEEEREISDRLLEGKDELISEKDKYIELQEEENKALNERLSLSREKIVSLEDKVDVLEEENKVLNAEIDNQKSVNLAQNLTYGMSGVAIGVLVSFILAN